jgi:hypothetical protein
LFSKVNSDDKNASRKFGEEVGLPLRTFLKEQLEAKAISSLAEIEEQYNSYDPIFIDQNFQNDDGLELQSARQKVIIMHNCRKKIFI